MLPVLATSPLVPATGVVFVLVGLGLVVLGLAGVAHRHARRGWIGASLGLLTLVGGLGLLGLL